jgi:hypothetical protein
MKNNLVTPSDLNSLIEESGCEWLVAISCIKRKDSSMGIGPETVQETLIKAREAVTS